MSDHVNVAIREDRGSLHPTSRSSLADGEAGPGGADRLAGFGEMTERIVHDLRNILAIIESGLTLAGRHAESPDKVRQFIAGAHDGAERGLKLTSQLLIFAKQQVQGPQIVDANELLRRLEPFLTIGAGRGPRILMRLAPKIPSCSVDASQFDAAILNLVINARDASPQGGEICISTALDSPDEGAGKPGLRVRVKDDGCGMEREIIDKIFDPFFTTKGDRGTGLGLPQVRAFMLSMGGRLEVTSEPGRGTSVDLLFPSCP
jgi:signal transduction histidine kinase